MTDIKELMTEKCPRKKLKIAIDMFGKNGKDIIQFLTNPEGMFFKEGQNVYCIRDVSEYNKRSSYFVKVRTNKQDFNFEELIDFKSEYKLPNEYVAWLHLSKNLSMNRLGEKLEDIFDIDSALIILKNTSTNKVKSIDRNKFREIDNESINKIIKEVL